MKMTAVVKMPTNVGVSNNNNNNFSVKENLPAQKPHVFYGGYNTTATNATTDVAHATNPGSNGSSAHVKQCAGCGVKIIDRFLLHAMDKYWHTGCLKCSCCQAHLGEIGTTCFTRNGMILCKNDYLRLFGNTGTCTGCSQSIPAQEFVMKAQSHVYHVQCFSCVVCRCQLMRGDRFSLYQGHLLCEHDLPKVVRGTVQIPPSITTSKVC